MLLRLLAGQAPRYRQRLQPHTNPLPPLAPPSPHPYGTQSVLGVGAFARERGAGLACVDEAGMEAWLRSPQGEGRILRRARGTLFA